jgi:hypothetical protein
MCKVREPAHCFGASEVKIDAPWSVAILGSTQKYQCDCHTTHHSGGDPSTEKLLQLAARRCQTTPEAIRTAVQWFGRLDRLASSWKIQAALIDLALIDMEAERLALIALELHGRFGNARV